MINFFLRNSSKYEESEEEENKQGGLCAYSGIEMTYGINKEFKCSIERINPELRYIKGNVCFICFEFNTGDTTNTRKYGGDGSGAWSRAKFENIYSYISKKYGEEKLI